MCSMISLSGAGARELKMLARASVMNDSLCAKWQLGKGEEVATERAWDFPILS